MAKLIWTEESLTWLHDIGEYLAERNPQAAANVLEGIYKKTQILTQHPLLGFRFSDITDREVRTLLYGHYRIMYEVSDHETIYILAVFHSAMDIERLDF